MLSRPDTDPELWEEYLRGAERSYQNHGVARALDIDEIRDGADTAMFWATLDAAGRVIGGVRAKGPLRSADDSHATVEWAGQPGLSAVRKMIDDRVPFGILEMKAAWITDDRETARRLSRALARSGFHAMALMGIQFCMATSAPYILDSWRTSGGGGGADPGHSVPRREVPDQDDVVGSAHVRQTCGPGSGFEDSDGNGDRVESTRDPRPRLG